MPIYRCPDTPTEDLSGRPVTPQQIVIGCGHIIDVEPADDGLVDCPECGVWFDPSREKNAGPFSPVEVLVLEGGEE